MQAVRLSCVRSIRGRISKPSRSCQDGFHTRKIIVADEVDIQEDAAGADFRTDLPTDI